MLLPRLTPLVALLSTSSVYWLPGVVPSSVTSNVAPLWNTTAPEKFQIPSPPNVPKGPTLREPALIDPSTKSVPVIAVDRARAVHGDRAGRERAVSAGHELPGALDEPTELVGSTSWGRRPRGW